MCSLNRDGEGLPGPLSRFSFTAGTVVPSFSLAPISQLPCKSLVKVNKHSEIPDVTYSCVHVHLTRLRWASDRRTGSHCTELNSPVWPPFLLFHRHTRSNSRQRAFLEGLTHLCSRCCVKAFTTESNLILTTTLGK